MEGPAVEGQVISANALRDGRVVYLTGAGSWSAALASARLFTAEADLQAALARAAADQGRIVGPAAVPVKRPPGGGPPVPCRLRDRLRRDGPGHLAAGG